MAVSRTVKGCFTVLGGFLIHFTLGTLYTFGNINPYFTSYMRLHSYSTDINYSQSLWVFALTLFGQGFTMPLGGLLEKKIGARLTVLLGGWIMSAGVALSYFTVKTYLAAIIVTMGLMFGFGIGVAYAVAIAAAMAWFPRNKGLVVGVVVAGFGGGAFAFNQVQTFYINPHNVEPNVTIGHSKYFDDPDMLSRVPSCFLVLGGMYAVMQLIGALMISTVPPQTEEEQHLLSRTAEEEEAKTELIHHVEEEIALKPLEMLREFDFWILWSTFFVNSIPVVFISTLYKAFGELEIESDFFLAIVGSLAALFNAGGRIMWGQLSDRIKYKWLMAAQTILMTALQLSFFYTIKVNEYMYLVWVCLLFLGISGNFALFPSACSRGFGHKYMATNYGLVFTGNATAGLVGAFLSTLLMNWIGWFGMFALGAGCSVIGFFLSLLHRGTISQR